MKLNMYRGLWSDPQLRKVLLMGVAAKIPVVAIPAVLTLHVVLGLKAGFAAAGLVSAAWMVGAALGAPLQGRWMDERGIRPVLGVVIGAQAIFWASASHVPYALLLAITLIAGLLSFAAFTIGRMAIAELATEEVRHTAYALDSITTEIAYMTGPPVAVALCAAMSTQAATQSVGIAIVLSALGYFYFNPRVAGKPRQEKPLVQEGKRHLLKGRLLAAFIFAAVSTLVIASYEVAGLAALKHFNEMGWAPAFYIVCGIASLVGGLVYGGLSRPPSAFALCVAIGLTTALAGVAANAVWLCLLIIPAAMLCAPILAATANDVSLHAPADRKGLAMGAYGSALTVGNAVGFPLAGLMVDLIGYAWTFGTMGGLGLLIAGIARILPVHTDSRLSEPLHHHASSMSAPPEKHQT